MKQKADTAVLTEGQEGAALPASRVNQAPALSLPWARVDGDVIQPDGSGSPICGAYGSTSNPRIAQDMDYIVHACNNYPRLVETLRGLMGLVQLIDIGDGRYHRGNHRYVDADALLRELGESK